MRSTRYIHGFSLFAYLWVAVGLSEIALMTWLAVDHHEVSATVQEHGVRVVLHHHSGDHMSAAYTMADTEDLPDHVLDLPDHADALLATPMAKEIKAAKVLLTNIPIALTQICTALFRVTLLAQPPPPSRNHTLSFFRTILLLI